MLAQNDRITKLAFRKEVVRFAPFISLVWMLRRSTNTGEGLVFVIQSVKERGHLVLVGNSKPDQRRGNRVCSRVSLELLASHRLPSVSVCVPQVDVGLQSKPHFVAVQIHGSNFVLRDI